MLNRLQNKNVLITGASSGIGKACAYQFAESGANLILLARRFERLVELKSDLEAKYKVSVQIHQLDVTDKPQVYKVLPELLENTSIDVLVNNAGLALGLDYVINDDISNWETMIETNIKGLLYVLQIVAKKMSIQKHGHIINIGSIAGVEAYAKGAAYCGTKHAVHAITQATREEMVEFGVKVSEVLPGAINTEFSLVRFNGDKDKADAVYKGFDALTAEDVAEIIVYNANLPKHVNLAESIVLAGSQSRATKIHKINN